MPANAIPFCPDNGKGILQRIVSEICLPHDTPDGSYHSRLHGGDQLIVESLVRHGAVRNTLITNGLLKRNRDIHGSPTLSNRRRSRLCLLKWKKMYHEICVQVNKSRRSDGFISEGNFRRLR